MPWNYLIIIYFIILSTVQAKVMMPVSDDELIIRGLLYEEYKSYENSRLVYAKLFDTTNEEVYLYKEARSSLLGRTHMNESIKRLKSWDTLHPDSLNTKRLLIPLYLSNKKINLAKNESEELIELSQIPMDYELASNSFLYAGEYKRALSLLEKAYSENHSVKILLRMVDIMDKYTNEHTKAIQLLETYRRMNVYSDNVLTRLLSLYNEDNNYNGLLNTYIAIYDETANDKIVNYIIELYIYKKDTNGLIKFLEEHNIGKEILYELYKNKKLYKKALNVLEKIYKKDKNPQWIAEKGILLFESAKNKKDKEFIEKVINQFDEAIAHGVDDSIYLNYYGYTLIDNNIDVDKGIKIISNALKQQPYNTFYLDSLAWGYYKKHQCAKAYKTMKKVVDEEGLNVKEIIEHWKVIKNCK